MTRPKKFLLTATLALAVSTAASGCSLFERSSPPSTPQGNGGGSPSTSRVVEPSKPPTTSERTDGSVTARIKGSDEVSCGSINSEITVTAQGRSQWTAEAKRTYVQSDRGIANGVTLSQTSGVLDSGKSATIRVQGSYDGAAKAFYVFVMGPNRSGSGGTVLEFKCR